MMTWGTVLMLLVLMIAVTGMVVVISGVYDAIKGRKMERIFNGVRKLADDYAHDWYPTIQDHALEQFDKCMDKMAERLPAMVVSCMKAAMEIGKEDVKEPEPKIGFKNWDSDEEEK